MPQTYAERPNVFFRMVVGVLAAAWLYAFLPPMQHLGLLQGASTMLPVMAVLVVGQFFPWRWIRPLLALFAILIYTGFWWVQANGPIAVMKLLLRETGADIVQGLHTMRFGEPLQTELFLLVLCLVYWLIVYAALRPKLWAFYNLLAVLVLGIVDGNTPVHPNASIVVQLLLFIALLGVMQYRRISGQLIYRGRPGLRFFMPLVALLVVAAGLGFIVPKPGAVWADPFARFENGTSGAGPAMKQIGYQMDNTRLGGSFVANHDPVLSYISPTPTYLRGAVYSQYTGHGWLPGSSDLRPLTVGQQIPSAAQQVNLSSGVQYTPLTEQIRVLSNKLNVPIIFAAYSAQKIASDLSSSKGAGIDVNAATDVLYGPPLAAGQVYTITSEQMQPPDGILSALPALPKNAATAYPSSIANEYLQLPSSLPSDVHQLTLSLTQGMTSEYDMVMAVQNYLKLNYAYSTEGIPVPGPGQDYVSQFLFDTKKGYCNNFSTSMAVMLRTIGIPTRWVTGFAPGTMDPQYNGTNDRFIVTNADAHSWVEVYFPKVGWVPFDPTPNFDMTFAIPNTPNATAPVTPPTKPVTPPTPPVVQPTGGGSGGGSSFHIPWNTILHGAAWTLLVFVILALVLVFLFRHRIQEWRHGRAWRSDTTEGLQRGVVHLVRLLIRFGELKKQTPTIRDLYPAARSYGVEEEDFRDFVETFEVIAYGGLKKPDKSRLKRVRGIWNHWVIEVLRRGR
ncbi:transglutaminaseTgpA domain-containing protein [Alicyclobacillus ferrooxydans]|uniref:transglutaminase family protein n=1 Tax=Alicyclobacillus ferrooxydans TaxID=471514 RepID=UPI0006D573D4|nr:DUF3488 and transglutaminase-like domain-containing protein [Alicyclobacillus ferrooxydans]